MDRNDLRKRYQNKSDEDLFFVIENPSNYNPEVILVVKEIIEERGGIDKIVNVQVEKLETEAEYRRLQDEIWSLLNKGYEESEITNKLNSETLLENELENLITSETEKWKMEQEDKRINAKSILLGSIGAFIGGTIGGILWGIMMIKSGYIFYFFGILLALFCYFCVWIFSRKSRRNIATIGLTLLSFVYALLLGFFLFWYYGPADYLVH